MFTKRYFVYILASQRNGTLYVGVTNNIARRTWEHKNGIKSLFPSKYKVYTLVYYEMFEDIQHALKREKQLKKYNRRWKLDLIEENNPKWLDKYEDLAGYIQD